jgi:hypothetical protein
MASLQELLAYAEHQDRVHNPGIGIVENAISGFSKGQAQGAAMKKYALDRSLKLLEIKEKMQKMEQDQANFELTKGFAKAAGLLPLDENEEKAARVTAGANLGDGKDPQMTNTPKGKLTKLWKMADPESTEIYPSLGKNGLSFTWKRKPAGAGGNKTLTRAQNIALQGKVESLARKMADTEEFEKLKSNPAYNPMMPPATTHPSQIQIDKYKQRAYEFLTGDKKAYSEGMKDIQDKNDPLGGLFDENDLLSNDEEDQ